MENEKLNIETLMKYEKDGWLRFQQHPTHPLLIWNYTPKTQYSQYWNNITKNCRGLVTDTSGKIIARCFPKFHNLEELKPEDIPNESFEVFEKMDGSLGILFNYKDEWIMATRGSFTSDQALKGFEMLKKYNYESLPEDYTYLFEIIYNDNRIVCQYDYEDLVLLGMIETETGEEIRVHHSDEYNGMVRFLMVMRNLGFKIVKKYDGINEYDTLKSIVSNDAEGFVIRFKNGLRMKIKGEEYCRLHRILTNISNRNIWEYLKDGKPLDDLLEKVPDEFYNWVKKTVSNLKYGYWRISEDAGKMHDYFRYGKYGDVDPMPTKKEFAEFVSKQPPIYRAVMFKIWDGKPYDDVIWRMLYPNKVEQPFKKLDDE